MLSLQEDIIEDERKGLIYSHVLHVVKRMEEWIDESRGQGHKAR